MEHSLPSKGNGLPLQRQLDISSIFEILLPTHYRAWTAFSYLSVYTWSLESRILTLTLSFLGILRTIKYMVLFWTMHVEENQNVEQSSG